MSDEINNALNQVSITLEFPLQDVNVLLNILNAPLSSQSVVNASFINAIQNQAGPQVEKARVAMEAAAEKKDEPEAAA